MLSRIFTLLLLLLTTKLCAQESITVKVRNADNGEPLEFVYVNVYDSARTLQSTSFTGVDGSVAVSVSNFPAKLEVTAFGYTPVQRELKSGVQTISVALEKRFNTLDEVVVTGVVAPIKPQDALTTYRIITAASIKAQGAITLNEVLDNQLNMNISNDGVLGAGVRMQGLGGDKVKTLIDGVAVNGREGGNIDMGQISLQNVERIEIVQGPMSVIYGSDALGGVINVIEKQNRKPYELQGTFNYESIGKYNVNVGAAKSWKKHSVSLGGGRNFFEGWKYLDKPVSYNDDSVLAQRHLLFKPREQYVANGGYQYRATSGFKLNFASNFLREKVTNKGPIATFNPVAVWANDEYYYTTRSQNRLSLEGKLGKKATWQIMNGYAYYRRVRNTYRTDLTTLSREMSSAGGVQDTSVFNDISSRGMYQNRFAWFELTAGYDVTYQQGNSRKIAGGDLSIGDYAAFALATFPFLKDDKLKIQMGARASYNTRFSSPLVPAVNVLFSLSERTQMRASYSKGFRAPSLKEMYLTFMDQNHKILGNEQLKAETGDHLQFSVSGNLKKESNRYAQVTATVFYNHVHDGITLVPVRPEDSTSIEYTYGNLSEQKNVIGNIQFEGQWYNLHYSLGYGLNRTFVVQGSGDFTAQEFTSNLFYYWKFARINFGAFYKYTGAQPFLRASIDGSVSYDGRQPDYHMLDASIERKFWKNRISLTAGVKNILDVQRLNATGLTSGGIHSGNGSINFLPRSLFTTLRFTLD